MSNAIQTSRAFCLRNNSAQEVSPVTEPWLNTVPIPPFKNKNEYRDWCKKPDTDYCFFSMVEGDVSTMRLGSGNKAHRLHGLVADFDCPGLTGEEIARGMARISHRFPPFAWNRTFSGGMRVVWVFEEPVFFYNRETFKRFVNRCVREFKARDMFPNLDDHITMPELYYCAGNNWIVSPSRQTVSSAALHLWLADASKNDDFDGGTEIPIDVVAAEVEKKFPGRWEGPFTVGARGVRFWEPGADAKAAIVRPTGMQAFTGDDGFLSWERIFGREFVQAFVENKTGAAIRDLFYDGKYIYRQLHDESWDAMSIDTAKRHLGVQFQLMSDKDGGPSSEVDMVLHRVENTKRVAAAMPFPHNPNRLVHFNGQTILNVATARLWPAALDEQEWGENFPWVASYLSTLFDTDESLTAFLCWSHVWVKSLHEGQPCKGQALFIIGPPGTGKTLLSTQILARMVGGSVEATQFIVEGNKYNDSLFNKALWTIDDAIAATDSKAHGKFSSTLKACVANGTFHYEKKFGSAGDLPFSGRLVVTLNEDPNSLSILPDADQNLTDKIFILRTGNLPADVAAKESERYEVIERELGAFVRWLIDFKIPDHIERDLRFGIKAYHDPITLDEARSNTVGSGFIEAIDLWRKAVGELVTEADLKKDPERGYWCGTSTQLHSALHQMEATRSAVSRCTPAWLGRHINQAMASGNTWLSRFRAADKSKVIKIKIK